MPKENNKTKDSTNSGVTLNGINHQVESAAELEESPSLLHLNYFKKPFRNIDNNSDDFKQSHKDKESTTSRLKINLFIKSVVIKYIYGYIKHMNGSLLQEYPTF